MELEIIGPRKLLLSFKSLAIIRQIRVSMPSISSACTPISMCRQLHCINAERIVRLPDDEWIINTGCGELIDQTAVIAALESGKLAGYAAGVLDEEAPPSDHLLLHHPKVIITPHLGPRTFESVPRQAMKSLTNLINALKREGECNCSNGVIWKINTSHPRSVTA